MNEENLINLDRLVRSCAGLVTVDKESQIVRLIHQTAQDFFGGRLGEFFLDAHTQLARTCLTYLRFNEISQGPCEIRSCHPFTEDHKIKGPVAASAFMPTRLKRNPFMEYAAHHWGGHARGEATERTLEREIVTFLSTPKTHASTVQVQYRDANLSYKRSLTSSKHTPIHVAVSFALRYLTEALLRDVTDTDLDAEDESKKTAFHWAVESGLAGCARSLLAAGADIRTQVDKGYTAFYKASALGYTSIVKMILEHDKAIRLTKKEISCAVLSNQEMVIETSIRAAPKPADRLERLCCTYLHPRRTHSKSVLNISCTTVTASPRLVTEVPTS